MMDTAMPSLRMPRMTRSPFSTLPQRNCWYTRATFTLCKMKVGFLAKLNQKHWPSEAFDVMDAIGGGPAPGWSARTSNRFQAGWLLAEFSMVGLLVTSFTQIIAYPHLLEIGDP